MCIYQPDSSHLTGWGMPFAKFFDSTVSVINKAVGGESTRTFIEEKLWQPVSGKLKAGDYLLIQFGHNDEIPSKESYTTPKDFKSNLTRFIKEARNKKAFPVLITPVARRKFDESGKIQDVHVVYAGLMREVANENHVPLIDLNKKSQELLQQFGPEKSKALFVALGANPWVPKDQEDITHFNEFGAAQMAAIVLEESKALKLEWTNRTIQPQR
jgi:lysophospholipase L1-like esterase